MNKLGKFLIILKVLISILLPYLLFFKMHAEVLINNANVFKTIGSIYLYPLGLISLILIVLELILYPFVMSKYTQNSSILQVLKNKLFGFDLVLILITTLVFIYNIIQLPFYIQFNLLNCYTFLTVFCILVYMFLTLTILRILSS